MKKQVEKFINEYGMLDRCDRLIIGLSGGADSVCLFLILKEICDNRGIKMTAVHVNHGIRAKEAVRDENFGRDLCAKYGVEYVTKHFDVPSYADKHGLSCEEAGRVLRYTVFNEVADGYGNARIAVAHHMDDQAETVLFNMCRGSSLKGLCGMHPVNGRIIRPLLCVRKDEIVNFLRDCGQEYCEDCTNADDDYSRNRIRHNVLPWLSREINGSTVKNIVSLSLDVSEAEDYLSMETDKIYRCISTEAGGGILLRELENLNPFMAKRVIRVCFEKLAGGLKDFGRIHVERVYELLFAEHGRDTRIRQDIFACRNQDGLYIYRNEEREGLGELTVEMNFSGKKYVGDFSFEVLDWNGTEKISNEVYTKVFDYDKIKNDLLIRNRRDGDYFVIDEAGRRKKLNQFFIDKKVPERIRDYVPLLAEESHVLWIVGQRISSWYKVTDDTRRILKVNYGGNDGTY